MQPTPPLVRSALPTDAAALATLATSTFLHTWRDLVPSGDAQDYVLATFTAEAFAADLTRPCVTYLVLETDERALVGYARLSLGETAPKPLDLPQPALLDRFYLDARWHGTGAAQRLFDAVLERAKANQTLTLWLCHHPSNLRAGRFYQRLGFQDTGVGNPFTLADRVYHDTVLVRPV